MIVQGLVSTSYRGVYKPSNTETMRPFVSGAPSPVQPVYPFRKGLPDIVIRRSKQIRTNPDKLQQLLPKLTSMIQLNPNILDTIDKKMTQWLSQKPLVPTGSVTGPSAGMPLNMPPSLSPEDQDVWAWIESRIPGAATVTDSELERELEDIINNLTPSVSGPEQIPLVSSGTQMTPIETATAETSTDSLEQQIRDFTDNYMAVSELLLKEQNLSSAYKQQLDKTLRVVERALDAVLGTNKWRDFVEPGLPPDEALKQFFTVIGNNPEKLRKVLAKFLDLTEKLKQVRDVSTSPMSTIPPPITTQFPVASTPDILTGANYESALNEAIGSATTSSSSSGSNWSTGSQPKKGKVKKRVRSYNKKR